MADPAAARPADHVRRYEARKNGELGVRRGIIGGMSTVRVEPNKRLNEADRKQLGEQLAQEYAAGASMATLAARHRTSAGRVRLVLLDHGVTLRPRGGDMRSDHARHRRPQA